ncbi:MAG: ExbD/TolR family protein [Cytophagaceae bacterium]
MAEINSGDGGKGKKGGKVRSKKMSTKVDMTPMVDLAFLLITFFMLTTTFNKPQTMEVNMPDKTDDNKTMDLKESKALTIVIGEGDKLYWYVGLQDPEVQVTDYSDKGIRKLLQTKNNEIQDLVVIIKAMDKSRYKNIVDILDEMHISQVKRYAVVDITPVDIELIEKI